MFITFIRRACVKFAVVAGASFIATSALAASNAEASPCSLTTITAPSISSVPYIRPPVEARSTDPVGPFPLSAIVPFPWSTIQGIWTMKLPNGTSLFFSFEVAADCAGRKFVQVLGFDQKTYRVLAEGLGIATTNDTIVRAAMTSASSQYMVYIRQFKLPQGRATGKVSTVVTIRPFDGDVSNDVHMIARKASPLTLNDYVQQQRALEEKRAIQSRRSVSAHP